MLTALVFREADKQPQSEQKFLLVDFTESLHYYLQNILWERIARKKSKNALLCSSVWGDQLKNMQWILSIVNHLSVYIACGSLPPATQTVCYGEKKGSRVLLLCTDTDYTWSSSDSVHKTIILCNAILLLQKQIQSHNSSWAFCVSPEKEVTLC